MEWPDVEPNRTQRAGKYNDWKQEIAKDCRNRCVYCAISDALYGGLDNFHIEHFRPKSKFKKLTHIIENLFLACAICNRFKSDDWPNEPTDAGDICAYPDPSKIAYREIFNSNTVGILGGANVSGRYVLARLYLNRPQLVRLRRIFALISELKNVRTKLEANAKQLAKSSVDGELVARNLVLVIETQNRLANLLERIQNESPYELAEVRRPK